jgi:hypothetical protein
MTSGAVNGMHSVSAGCRAENQGKTYTTRVCPADGCSLHGCQQSASPDGEVHTIGLGDGSSLFRATGDALPRARRQATSVALIVKGSMVSIRQVFTTGRRVVVFHRWTSARVICLPRIVARLVARRQHMDIAEHDSVEYGKNKKSLPSC